ncbi:MAG: hypothetical protein IRY87_06175 [Acetobacteraceae bacterium]|nr:hypothetical protein [Acetobacteraceae bacterium]
MRPRFLSAIGAAALLGLGLSACAPVGRPGWGGSGYYSGHYPGYAVSPGYYRGYPGLLYERHHYAVYGDRYRAVPPQHRIERPQVRPAPRHEPGLHEQLRHHWCSKPGANCRG